MPCCSAHRPAGASSSSSVGNPMQNNQPLTASSTAQMQQHHADVDAPTIHPSVTPSPRAVLMARGRRMRKTGQMASRTLSRILLSLLLHRHAMLLLVPVFYFWGMVLMMQGGDMEAQSSNALLPAQPQSAGSHSWGMYSLGEMLLQGTSNTTSWNFLVYPSSAHRMAIDGDPLF